MITFSYLLHIFISQLFSYSSYLRLFYSGVRSQDYSTLAMVWLSDNALAVINKLLYARAG